MRCGRFLAFIVATSLATSVGHSAEIKKVKRPACDYLLEGGIVNGDLDRLKALKMERGHSLCLDSLGGSYSVGLELAEYLAGMNVTTVVDEGAKCLSSCANVFMGGSDWEEIYLPKRKMHIKAVVGFHAPFLDLENKQYSAAHVHAAYAVGLESVARMMKLGHDRTGEGFIPNRVILELLQKGPDEAYSVDTVLSVCPKSC